MIIPYSVHSGQYNMDYDSHLLDSAIEQKLSEPIFRLYGWNPSCVSLGRNQNENFLDKDFLSKQNIDVVRRITGGRALFHNDEITYCFVCNADILENGDSVINSYHEISQFLIDTFSDLNIEISYGQKKVSKIAKDYCMLLSTGADLCYKNKKIIGSAQCRKNGYILQHGSILYNYDIELLKKIFENSAIDTNITSVKEINSNITKDSLIKLLENNIKKFWNI